MSQASATYPQGFLGPFRRLAGRLARRAFRRQVAINRSVCERLDLIESALAAPPAFPPETLARIDALERRQESVEARADQSLALGWDYVALVRRLSWLEEQVEALLAERERAAQSAAGESRAA